MILLAGINGAGKTSFYYTKVKPTLEAQGFEVPFVNADEIEKEMFPNDVGNKSYTAAKQAAKLREYYFENKNSFVTETVFSHQSKIDLIGQAKEQGFEVVLNHVHVDHADKAIKRVGSRVQVGGHAVPDQKVRERFPRTIKNLQTAITKADRAYVWDNNHKATSKNPMHRFVFSMHKGKINKISDVVPSWAMQMYGQHIEAYVLRKEAILSSAKSSLEKDAGDANRQRVFDILTQAGIRFNEIDEVFKDYGGLPSFLRFINK